ncbi:SAM-dependent methyltransferase [Mycetocola zhujimingii]|uniref:SAM-dependent methyltransferase n=1 Tax=Mycetocola zhujimingii TaxID=2079792 RepID=A0A2U1TDH1_9MICO|nr:SAM-dependent methyltransferase [Mycetocola zhujimingii]PWC06945.1 SAM-dependent methyltransferase [Mycetocola zhujimingii]
MPIGTITRGTTNTNRLRRVDRFLQTLPVMRTAADPLVVDLGYGASAVTSLELHARLRKIRPDVEVLGLEIDKDRVQRATSQLESVRRGETGFPADARVSFARGGFEVPVHDGRRPAVIRAFNVLRQYDEDQVADAWGLMVSRLQPHGVLVEGTCDEIGRISSWVSVTADGPRSLTISLRLDELDRPSIVAERLPKALIHRNVSGERIALLMTELDRQWQYSAPLAPYGPVQRWIATVTGLATAGWPVFGTRARWRLGELTVPWDSVAPN